MGGLFGRPRRNPCRDSARMRQGGRLLRRLQDRGLHRPAPVHVADTLPTARAHALRTFNVDDGAAFLLFVDWRCVEQGGHAYGSVLERFGCSKAGYCNSTSEVAAARVEDKINHMETFGEYDIAWLAEFVDNERLGDDLCSDTYVSLNHGRGVLTFNREDAHTYAPTERRPSVDVALG